MRFNATDIKDKKEFNFEGELLKMKECYDEEKHIYIYERYNSAGRIYAYEVVKGVRCKNNDGSEVFSYPSTEKIGRGYGYFVAKNYAYSEKGIYYYAQKLAQ